MEQEQQQEHSSTVALSTQLLAGNSLFLVAAGKHQLDDYVQPLGQLLGASTAAYRVIIVVATRHRLLQLRAKLPLCHSNDLLIATTAQLSASLLLPAARWDCLVLDELQQLLAYGGSSFQALKCALLQRRCQSTQLVVTTRLWQAEEMKPLLRHAKQPLLLFRDPLEAAACGGLVLELVLADSWAQQLQQLREYLQRHQPQSKRALIYCARSADMRQLQLELPQGMLLLHCGRSDKARIEQWQRQHSGKILLLQAHAPELHVNNVQSLIHCNMPATWSQFRKRFAVFGSQAHCASQQPALQSLVLLDAQARESLPQLIEFMQQHGLPIDERLRVAHAQLLAAREARRVARQCVLCPVLLLYGQCVTSTCRYRHMLSECDANRGTVPTAGHIRFQLLKLCTPAHLAVRLLAHKASVDSPWQALSQAQRYEQLQQQLCSYFATPEHCVTPTLSQLQQICVRRVAEKCYERVSVTFVPPASTDAAALTVRVKHLDQDTVIHHAKLSELLRCPHELQQIEALALDLRLAGVVPYDGEQIWQCTETAAAAELLQREGGNYEAYVDFSLGHTIFASNLQQEQHEYMQQLQSAELAKFDNDIKQRLEQFVKALDK
ncbi:hypothetical protein KR222_000870 [Zaprionus bogoriensis]|nr:hypothetical protein KR222_000870 [Zaprionus bogoriensis]